MYLVFLDKRKVCQGFNQPTATQKSNGFHTSNMKVILCFLALQSFFCESKFVGNFTTLAHGVTGQVYVIDNHTLEIKHFNYDGKHCQRNESDLDRFPCEDYDC